MSGSAAAIYENAPYQPESFDFSAANEKKIPALIAKYPPGKQASAVLPLLQLAQQQNDNWLPRAAMDKVAEVLDMAKIRVYEVATFYSMFNLKPVGKHFIQACTTTPCWLCGSDNVLKACKDKLGITPGQSTEDGKFTLVEVECLGACVNGPMVQINDDYFEDLSYDNMCTLIDDLAAGKKAKVGSQTGRQGSARQDGPTTLTGGKKDKVA